MEVSKRLREILAKCSPKFEVSRQLFEKSYEKLNPETLKASPTRLRAQTDQDVNVVPRSDSGSRLEPRRHTAPRFTPKKTPSHLVEH